MVVDQSFEISDLAFVECFAVFVPMFSSDTRFGHREGAEADSNASGRSCADVHSTCADTNAAWFDIWRGTTLASSEILVQEFFRMIRMLQQPQLCTLTEYQGDHKFLSF